MRSALAVAVGCLTLTGLLLLAPSAAQEPKPAPDPKPAVKPQANVAGRMVVRRHDKFILIDPVDPKSAKVVAEPGKDELIQQPTLSPDGKRIVYISHRQPAAGMEDTPPTRIMVQDLDGKEKGKEVATALAAVWGATADELLVLETKLSSDGKIQTFVGKSLSLSTGKSTELPVPAGHMPYDEMSRDGKAFLTMKSGSMGWKPSLIACRVSRDGKKVEQITDPAYMAYNGSLSPDGKTVVFTGSKVPDDPKKLGEPSKMYVQPVGGKVVELAGAPAGEHTGLCWSPDGKRIAYLWRQMHAELIEDGKPDERETETRLYVCDADGKNHRLLLSEKGKGQRTNTISGLDWR